MLKTRPRARLFVFSLLLAVLFLTIASQNSFLYPMNLWVDENCFYTVGKGILHGVVPYRDICEQKGPVLYFLFAFAAWLTPKSFLGAFALEIAAFTAFLYDCGRILGFSRAKRDPWLLLPLLACITVFSQAFSNGGSAEEFCLPLMTLPLYRLLLMARQQRGPRFWEALVTGLFFGIVFWIKYAMVGFYAGLALYVLISDIRERRYKNLWLSIFAFLLGFVLVTGATLAYFLRKNALNDLFRVYFYDNIVIYSTVGDVAFASRFGIFRRVVNMLFSLALAFGKWFYRAPGFGLLTVLAVVFSLSAAEDVRFRREIRFGKRRLALSLNDESLVILLSGVLLYLSNYCGGVSAAHYQLSFAPYLPFGLLWLRRAASEKWGEKAGKLRAVLSRPGFLAAEIAVLCLFTLGVGRNRDYIRLEKSDRPQYQFAAVTDQKENATMLNFAFLDGGFYFASDIVPNCYYFCRLNLPLDYMKKEQDRYVREGLVDFVVTKNAMLEQKVPGCPYRLVKSAKSSEGDRYSLYEKTGG